MDAQSIGLVLSIGSIGALVAALTANRIGKRLGVGPTIVISAILLGPPLVILALAPANIAMPIAAASFFLATFSGVVYNINQVSFRQAITPERMQGRMNATMRFIVWGTIPVGNILGGILGGTIGLQTTILISGLLSFIPFLPVLFSPVRTIGEMPAPGAGDVPEAEIVGAALDETPRPGLAPRATIEDDLEADRA
jgi:MFS family permease